MPRLIREPPAPGSWCSAKTAGTIRRPACRTSRSPPIRAGWNTTPLEILANIRRCLSQCDMVDAIGLGHQGESLLARDADSGLPLYNAIVWQDQRTEPEIQRLKREGVEPLVMAKTGLPLDTYFSASKMGWLMNNAPGRAAGATRPPAARHHGRLLPVPPVRPASHRL